MMRQTALALGRRAAAASKVAAAGLAESALVGSAARAPMHARGIASKVIAAEFVAPSASRFLAGAAAFGGLFAASATMATAVNLVDVETLPQAKAAVPKVRRLTRRSRRHLAPMYPHQNISPTPISPARLAPQEKLPFSKVTLYQYDVCPFCNKVKAYLDYRGIPYDIVEVNPLTKSEIKFSKEYRKVPIVTVDDEQLNDSAHIIATLDERLGKIAPPGFIGGKAMTEKEEKWAKWVDAWFVHVITPNIYRTWAEAFKSFDYITERGKFGWVERQSVRLSGAVSMYLISQNVLKKRHGIEDERLELYKALEDWMENGVGGAAFCGGDKPNVADISVFGVLRAVKTFETFDDALANVKSVEGWYRRMEKEVGEATRTDGVAN